MLHCSKSPPIMLILMLNVSILCSTMCFICYTLCLIFPHCGYRKWVHGHGVVASYYLQLNFTEKRNKLNQLDDCTIRVQNWDAGKRLQVYNYIKRNSNKKRASRIHWSVIFYPKITKFSVELPAYKGTLHTKIKVNRSSRFRDTIEQSFSFFSSYSTNTKTALTQECMLRSSWNLAHV